MIESVNDPGMLAVLLLDDEPLVRSSLARLDLGRAVRLFPVATVAEAEAVLAARTVDVALVDQHLGPGEPSGLDWLYGLHERDPDCFRIVFTGSADLDFAVRAINGGSIDAFLAKPWVDEQVVALLYQGVETCLLRRHNRSLLAELSSRNADLLHFNANLERLVQERTTSLRAAHERLKQQQQALVRLETLGVVSHLARGLAHELNNPLAVILGYTQRLRRTADEQVKPRLDVILEEVERCRGLVDQLRRLAAPLDEPVVAVEPDTILRAALERRGVASLSLVCRERMPRVLAAPQALERVFSEIIANAIQAGARTMVCEAGIEYGRVELRILNDGATPSHEEAADATKPFFTTRASEGSRGLGLAVAAGLLRDQDGHLELRAGEPSGAVAVLHLPLADAEERPAVPGEAVAEQSGSVGGGFVLVVDDDILIGELLVDVIQEFGLQVRVAHSCGEARALVAGGGIVAVLADLNLTDGQGDALLDELEALGTLAGRTALLTGAQPPLSRRPVLAKPFTIDQVDALLQRLLPR